MAKGLKPAKGLKTRLNFATYSAYVRTMPTRNAWLAAVHAHRRRCNEVVARLVETRLLVVVAVERRSDGGRRGRGDHRCVVRRGGHCRSVHL